MSAAPRAARAATTAACSGPSTSNNLQDYLGRSLRAGDYNWYQL
ncbi:hypothetical protein [Streptomyces canus]